MKSADEQLAVIKRGIVELIPEPELIKKLQQGRPLKIKWGADPSAPDIHLGHTVILNKLRQFQDLGHEVIFLIGDFTAKIGDPSGKSETRPSLSDAEVKKNAKSYQQQVFKILDKRKTKVVYNSQWLKKMDLTDVFKLSSQYTVARMLERNDFSARFEAEKDISVVEFIYPLLQGHDSVHLKADIEIGGTDQKFNLLMGRTLQQKDKQEPQVVITMPLLEGTDGVKKMSKSLDNYIGVTEPAKEIFGKTMSISDAMMLRYYELLTNVSLDEVKVMHPRDAKVKLAKILVGRFHNEKAAQKAEAEFSSVFANKNQPQNIPLKVLAEKEISIADLIVLVEFAGSKAEARRLVKQGGVRIDGDVIMDEQLSIKLDKVRTIQVGKRKFYQVKSR
ncbi:MAG: tyrosine--tRNA ligase [bacterium]